MPELERLIGKWRATMAATPGVAPESLDELEHHLRETVAPLLRSGMDEAGAFERAVRQLGSGPALAVEFQKLNQTVWLPVKVAAGVGIALALAMIVLLVAHFHGVKWSVLLIGHIFTLTLGYVMALLTGMLGLCFVGQSCSRPFPVWRLQSLARATFNFTAVAAGLTATGLMLGALWANTALGRWWLWNAKETSALCVLGWLICLLLAQRVRRITTRAILVLSIAGNVLVILAWFGPFLIKVSRQELLPSYSPILMVVLIVHLAFLTAGLMPTSWLRPNKA